MDGPNCCFDHLFWSGWGGGLVTPLGRTSVYWKSRYITVNKWTPWQKKNSAKWRTRVAPRCNLPLTRPGRPYRAPAPALGPRGSWLMIEIRQHRKHPRMREATTSKRWLQWWIGSTVRLLIFGCSPFPLFGLSSMIPRKEEQTSGSQSQKDWAVTKSKKSTPN